jgi:hypothetical protein
LDERLISIRLLSSKGVIQVGRSQFQAKPTGQFSQTQQKSGRICSAGNGHQDMFAAFQHAVLADGSFDLNLERTG